MTDLSTASMSRRRWIQASVAWAAWAGGSSRADTGGTLRIGFQKGGGLLGLLKAQGQLEALLGPQGWQVTWHEFPAGPQLLEALNAGSVDFGYTGAPPPIFAQAADKDLVYVGAEPGAASSEAIVVKPGSVLRTLAELKGKRVAVQKGSSANHLLLAALEHAGVDCADIQPIYLAPADARAAFESDRVDAWSIWDPYLAAVQAALKVRVLADYSDLTLTHSFYEARRGFAESSPAILGPVLQTLAEIGAWASSHPDDVAEVLAPQLGLSAQVVQTWQRRTRYGVQPVDAAVLASQQRVADTFYAHRLIPQRVDVSRAVWHWARG